MCVSDSRNSLARPLQARNVTYCSRRGGPCRSGGRRGPTDCPGRRRDRPVYTYRGCPEPGRETPSTRDITCTDSRNTMTRGRCGRATAFVHLIAGKETPQWTEVRTGDRFRPRLHSDCGRRPDSSRQSGHRPSTGAVARNYSRNLRSDIGNASLHGLFADARPFRHIFCDSVSHPLRPFRTDAVAMGVILCVT